MHFRYPTGYGKIGLSFRWDSPLAFLPLECRHIEQFEVPGWIPSVCMLLHIATDKVQPCAKWIHLQLGGFGHNQSIWSGHSGGAAFKPLSLVSECQDTYGDKDVRAPLNVAEDLHAAIPTSRLVVMPGVGHMSNLEAAERFNAEVRSFLRSVDS